MAISDTVSVTISVQDAAPSVASFGTPLILAKHGNFVGGKLYAASPTGLAAMVGDGFSTNDRAYHLAQSIAAQSPHTKKFYVYERGTGGNSQIMTLTPQITTEGYEYVFQLRPTGQSVTTEITYTNGGAETPATIATALQGLCNAVTGVTAVDLVGSFSIAPTTANTFVYVDYVDGNALTVEDTSSDAGVATDLANANIDLGENFYGVILDSFSSAEIEAAATWCASNNKLLAAQSVDTSVTDSGSTTDPAYVLNAATNHNAFVLYTRHMSGNAAAGIMSRQFAFDPGSSSWRWKSIVNAVADNLTETEFSGADGKRAMCYISEKGISHTTSGRAASGRLLSTTRGVAWLKARIEESVLFVFANREKIGFDQGSVDLLLGAVSGVLSAAEANNFILPAGGDDGWFVTATPLSEVSSVDKANGTYDGIQFHAVLTGEVEQVVVDGTITL